MPLYVKFLKEILYNKRRFDNNGTIMLTKECNAIIHNKLAQKLNYSRSFSIPRVIKNTIIDIDLCNLRTSVSLMRLHICERLDLDEVKHTKMSIQLADKSIKYSVGILEDVPIRISQLYIPTDFVVMDIEEDTHISILSGRPFLAIVGAIIDVNTWNLTFEVGDEKI